VVRGLSLRFGQAGASHQPARRLCSAAVLLAFAWIALAQVPVAQTPATPAFIPLGQMPGSTFGTYADSISGDGNVVVGHGWMTGTDADAFRWTRTGGFENLRAGRPDVVDSHAYDVNVDGSVVVGYNRKSSFEHLGFRWTVAGGMEDLPLYEVSDVSADGTFMVGMNVWRKTNGETGSFGFLGGNNYTSALGVSASGQVVVGYSETSPNRYAHAFRWTPTGGIQDLGVTNGTESDARGISGNGLTIVGEARDGSGFWRAFRWTASLGMRDLGTLGGPMSAAYDASYDGSVIVGSSLNSSSSGSYRAFRWTAATGMKDVRQLLLDAGVTAVQNWVLLSANGVSDDGTAIAGYGLSPSKQWEPFLAILPPGGTAAPSLSSLTLSPNSVTGGNPSTGTATLTSAAPAGGQLVTLSSSNTAVATVPAGVTIAAGATSGNFAVTSVAATASTNVTISATSGGATRTAVLTVAPAGSNTGLRSPTANAAASGGDGNGFESSAQNAHADDALSAVDTNSGSGTSTSCTSASKDKHRFHNYGITLPAGVSVKGIEVRLDARVDSTSSAPKMCAQLSWDGGATWTTTKSTATLSTSMRTFTLGSATDLWGRAWTPGEFADGSFQVRIINVSSSTSRDFSLDWAAVRVHVQ
jgi:probable HAF family extracellular repeat protein